MGYAEIASDLLHFMYKLCFLQRIVNIHMHITFTRNTEKNHLHTKFIFSQDISNATLFVSNICISYNIVVCVIIHFKMNFK